FWAEQADELHWFKRPTQILRWEPPFARWFEDGTTNLAFNCLDRHLDTSIANRAALIWEGEPGEVRTLTYRQLAFETQRLANALELLGVCPGDRVGIYMGMVPEAVV